MREVQKISFIVLGKPHEIIAEIRFMLALERKLHTGWLVKYRVQKLEVN